MCKLGTPRDNEYIEAVHEKITKKKKFISQRLKLIMQKV